MFGADHVNAAQRTALDGRGAADASHGSSIIRRVAPPTCHGRVRKGRGAARYACTMLYLASQSPRRRELLAQIGAAFEIVDAEVPEARAPEEPPRMYVERVARAKARAGLRAVIARDPGAVVLGADTEVVLDGRVFGKPRDAEDAAAMLRALSGRTHIVISAVCCTTASDENIATCESSVMFAELDGSAIARYAASGEPFGKAGGYAIQGRAAGFIAHLSGSYSGVMGLPLFETARLLRAAGIAA